jgi:hypothetical protein
MKLRPLEILPSPRPWFTASLLSTRHGGTPISTYDHGRFMPGMEQVMRWRPSQPLVTDVYIRSGGSSWTGAYQGSLSITPEPQQTFAEGLDRLSRSLITRRWRQEKMERKIAAVGAGGRVELGSWIRRNLYSILNLPHIDTETKIGAIRQIGTLALLDASLIEPETVDTLVHALTNPCLGSRDRIDFLDGYRNITFTLESIAARRRDLVPVIISSLQEVLFTPELMVNAYRAAAATMGSVAVLCPEEIPGILDSISQNLTDTHGTRFRSGLYVLCDFIQKVPQSISWEWLVNVLETKTMPDHHREEVLNKIIEPLVFKKGAALTAEVFDRLCLTYQSSLRLRYFLFYLTHRPGLPAALRERALSKLEALKDTQELFPLHQSVRENLRIGKKKALIVHNTLEGFGDELIRMGTFIQALVDFNPELEVTVMTGRPSVYDHPRVQAVAIKGEVGDVFQASYDVVVSHLPDDESRLYSGILYGEVNRLRGRGTHLLTVDTQHFTRHDRQKHRFAIGDLRVDGIAWAEELGLNVMGTSVYEPGYRLLAELGIGFRVGSEIPPEESIMAGLKDKALKDEWDDLVAGNFEGRPVVFFNPFGGRNSNKGYAEGSRAINYQYSFSELAQRVQELVNMGYFVIFSPGSDVSELRQRTWARRSVAQDFVSSLDPRVQQYLAIIKDEDEMPEGALNYFTQAAAFLITVEGGMAHAAYLMGAPYYVLFTPKSGSESWIPFGTNENQRVIPGVDFDLALRELE